MGYTSEWVLALAGPRNMRLAALTWLEDQTYLKDPGAVGSNPARKDTRHRADIFETILGSRLKDVPGQLVVFYDSATKCYEPWDDCISEFLRYCEDDCKLEYSYVRLGEDGGDVDDRSNGQDLYVSWEHQIELSGVAPWHDERLQFCRLLNEIHAVGLTKRQLAELSASMDLPTVRIKELLSRASRRWDYFLKYRVRSSKCKLTKPKKEKK